MRRHLRSPLARYGFTALAVFALCTGQPIPFLVCAVIALYAWKNAR